MDGVSLVGTTTVQIGEDGFAKFFDLGIEGSSSGKQLALEFYLDGEGLEICVSLQKKTLKTLTSIGVLIYSHSYY